MSHRQIMEIHAGKLDMVREPRLCLVCSDTWNSFFWCAGMCKTRGFLTVVMNEGLFGRSG